MTTLDKLIAAELGLMLFGLFAVMGWHAARFFLTQRRRS